MQSAVRRYAVSAVLAVLAVVSLVLVNPARDAGASASHPPYGRLAHRSEATSLTGITDSEFTVYPLTATFSVTDPDYASRWVEFTAVLRVYTTAPGTANAWIDVDDNYCSTCAVERVAGSTTYLPQTGGAGAETMVIHGFAQLRVSSFTVTVKVKRVYGTGTWTVGQTAGTPMTMLVNDLGRP